MVVAVAAVVADAVVVVADAAAVRAAKPALAAMGVRVRPDRRGQSAQPRHPAMRRNPRKLQPAAMRPNVDDAAVAENAPVQALPIPK